MLATPAGTGMLSTVREARLQLHTLTAHDGGHFGTARFLRGFVYPLDADRVPSSLGLDQGEVSSGLEIESMESAELDMLTLTRDWAANMQCRPA